MQRDGGHLQLPILEMKYGAFLEWQTIRIAYMLSTKLCDKCENTNVVSFHKLLVYVNERRVSIVNFT
jgi:hypothetical protein